MKWIKHFKFQRLLLTFGFVAYYYGKAFVLNVVGGEEGDDVGEDANNYGKMFIINWEKKFGCNKSYDSKYHRYKKRFRIRF